MFAVLDGFLLAGKRRTQQLSPAPCCLPKGL